MGLFSSIMEKLGMGKAAAPPVYQIPKPPPYKVGQDPAPAAPPPPPQAVAMVDVVAQLEKRAADNTQKLNWKTSIVDLLKLLEIDSSLSARKDLARELDCPADLTEDSAKMNMWLHKTVLARIAQNGGNVPKELLD